MILTVQLGIGICHKLGGAKWFVKPYIEKHEKGEQNESNEQNETQQAILSCLIKHWRSYDGSTRVAIK